ncbi:MAG: DNA repair protein RecN [Lachnospira sp.]
MLTNLHVKNLALIEEENIDFGEGLNILSGETGAGKSIILGSINAALGSKTSPDFIRSGCEYGLTELVFSIDDESVMEKLKEYDIPDVEDGEIIISRKISPTRSQIRVNGQSFTAGQTRQLVSSLINIHGQHDSQLLMNEDNQLMIVDEYADKYIKELKRDMCNSFKEYQTARRLLSELDTDEEQRLREMSFLQFEISEIEEAKLKPGEDEELENEYKRLNNYQKIADNLSVADNLLNSGNSLSDMAGSCLKYVMTACEYDPELSNIRDTLADVESLIGEVNHSVREYIDNMNFDEESFSIIEKRLDRINELKMKYGSSIEEILESLEQKKEKLEKYSNFDLLLKERKDACMKAEAKARDTALKLSEERKKAAVSLEQELTDVLKELNFLDVQLRIDFFEDTLTSIGKDKVVMMISTNPGEELKPLSKVASGGELSRIMLAIKSTVAGMEKNVTMIFDEIDAGISGRTAQMVANKLCELSQSHQIICITHLPQLASMADSHYIIEKSTKDNRTISNIKCLNESESVNEIARMLGGTTITEAVLNNAKELKAFAKEFKKF